MCTARRGSCKIARICVCVRESSDFFFSRTEKSVEPSAGSDNGRMDECASSLTKRHESYPFMYECSVIGLFVVSRLKKQLRLE